MQNQPFNQPQQPRKPSFWKSKAGCFPLWILVGVAAFLCSMVGLFSMAAAAATLPHVADTPSTPTTVPTIAPTSVPTHVPTIAPTRAIPTPKPTKAPTPTPIPTPTEVPTTAPAQSCYPLTNSGNCYEPGEYCRTADHGASGIAGDGKTITCTYNDGWRWELSN